MHHAAIRRLTLATTMVWLVGCGGALGERCNGHDDCASGLRCSTPSGGVCVYPEGMGGADDVRPADSSAPGDLVADSRGGDHGRPPDAPKDSLRADSGAMDSTPDGTSRDVRQDTQSGDTSALSDGVD